MNTTNTTAPQPTVLLSTLLKHAVIDAKGQQLGKLADAIVRLRGNEYPLLSALVVRVGSGTIFVPISEVLVIESERIELSSARLDVRPFERRAGEVLLNADVLGHRLIDVDRATLVRAYDVHLALAEEGWIVTGLDVHKHGWFGGSHTRHPARDWASFEALIGHAPSLLVRSPFGQLRRLKPAQLADLIETASTKEQDELLAQVHDDPELEADVFEELDDDSQSRLLKSRSTQEIAAVLSRMRPDDAADAITDLPQERRQEVLDRLPEPQHRRVLALLGYHAETAGGLMGLDFLAVPESMSVDDALALVRSATESQAEALTTIFTLDETDVLTGSLSLVRALQSDPTMTIALVAEANPVHAAPEDDLIDVTGRMADFNLFVLPVLDEHGRILGVITVDDALEAAIPDDWRRREPQVHESSVPAIDQG